MVKTPSFKRLILRAVLRQVSPMVIGLVSVADQMPLHEFHDVFRTILGWNGDLGYIVRVHGQEINSFRRPLLDSHPLARKELARLRHPAFLRRVGQGEYKELHVTEQHWFDGQWVPRPVPRPTLERFGVLEQISGLASAGPVISKSTPIGKRSASCST